jgi:redox-sensing transcriptional repressor
MKKISDSTVERLAKYLRALEFFEKDEKFSVSSEELAESDGITSAQVRKDLSHFGTFGKRGYGYRTGELKRQIQMILGLTEKWQMAIVGVGNIGRALINFNDFKRYGFHIRAVFDNDENKIGLDYYGHTVHEMSTFQQRIKHLNVQIGVIAVQAEHAQMVADLMVESGIKAIMNFAPKSLRVPNDVCIRNQNIAIGLETLSFYLNNQNNS